ncbi:MAG: hypothetical protein WC854_10875 [Bacteroidales bacterium]
MTTKNILFFPLFLFIIYLPVYAQVHPHILVNNNDKSLILNKIKQQSWANTIYREMVKNITPYVERHKTEPEWILSRYLMNRVPEALNSGKTYTSDNWAFRGYFGVVGLDGEVVSALYIGEGKKISYKGYSVKVTDSNGSASLSLSGKNYLVSCNQTTVIGLPVVGAKSVSIISLD